MAQRVGTPHRAGWALLIAVSARSLPWSTFAAAAGLALGAAALGTVLPARGDAFLGAAGVLVLACGLAAVVDDDAAGATAPAPTSLRRRLAARAAIAVPVCGAALAGVVALVAGAGTGSSRNLVLSAVVLGGLAVGVAAAAVRRRADLPGAVAAAAVLVPAVVLLPLLPSAVLSVPVWDSTAERVAIAVAVSAGLIVLATRDPTLHR